ncbi:MAG: CinA family protein [Opitutaceae bacterium]|nr:CinA family protein [Opitutaceae bacterium]
MHDLRVLFLGPPRRTLAVAESLTCGRVQAAIGAISGASEFFLGGITAYTIDQKVRHLGVDRAAAEACEAVSPAIAGQMALGACRLFGSDLAVATTGYAEPAPARGITHPLAYWAIAHAGVVVREGRVERPGLARVAMQDAVAAEVLAALVEVVSLG